jgi:subtilisin family serine protease
VPHRKLQFRASRPAGSRRPIRLLGAALTLALALAPLTAAAEDPEVPKQWGLAKVKAPGAWDVTTGDGVLVGIVDSGVDLNHEEFAGRIAGSTNCLGAAHDPSKCTGNGQDDVGHGTHVAGIIVADKDNGKGITGVAPGARLLVAKVIDSQSGGDVGDIDAGVKWVIDHGAKVVNLSLSESSPLLASLLGSALRPTLDYAWSKGVVTVVAGGNASLLGLLGSYDFGTAPSLIVGATGPNDGVAPYSSPLGTAKWALLAPGGVGGDVPQQDILSTFWAPGAQNAYAYQAGTSMATPHVTGAVALLLSQGYSAQQAVDRILATVDPMSCGGNSPNCHGRLNVDAAVGDRAPSQPAQPGASPTPAPGTSGNGSGNPGSTGQPAASPQHKATTPAKTTGGKKATPTPAAPAPAAASPVPSPAPEASPSPSPVAEPSPSPADQRLETDAAAASDRGFPASLLIAIAGVLLMLVAGAIVFFGRRARRSGN